MLIEQAIFTSTETDRGAGYQLAATSPGIDAVDLRELRVWGPSHDSLVSTDDDAVSVNFHPLPSGAFCVSKTTPAGREYSGRRGRLVYTQCLVVPPEALLRFANNPFALLKAAFAQGSLCVHGQVPQSLAPFRLGGKAAAVDLALVGQLTDDPGARCLGALVERTLSSTSIVVMADRGRDRLIAGLINALPVECRTAVSFSTGLKPSPRRPFRLLGLADASSDKSHLQRHPELFVFDLTAGFRGESLDEGGWGSLVARMLETGRLAYFSAQLGHARPGLQPHGLPKLAGELWARMPPARCGRSGRRGPAQGRRANTEAEVAAAATCLGVGRNFGRASSTRDVLPSDDSNDEPVVETRPDQRRADAPHPRLWRTAAESTSQTAATALTLDAADAPSAALSWQCPEVVEKLELLDDLVFEAIAGKPSALVQLKSLWPSVLAEIPQSLLEESRAHYIRHALRVWQDCVEGGQIRNPALAVTTMEVVCLLFDA